MSVGMAAAAGGSGGAAGRGQRARQRPVLVLATCCLGLFVTGVDATGVTVALPAIGRSLHAPVPGLQWVMDGYTLALASLLLAAGSLADRAGRRRVFRAGLACFAAASLACSLAPSTGWLITFRVVQGAAASLLNPPALAIIAATFPDPARRARAFGVWSGVYGAAMAAGPLAGGVLLAVAGWRAVFWITVPVAAAALALTAVWVPESRPGQGRRADPGGQLLVTAALASLAYAIIGGPHAGWASARTLGGFGLAAAAVAALAWHSRRRAEPLIDPRLFRSGAFTGAAAIAVCGLAAAGGFSFLATLYLQQARGCSAMAAGLCTLPMAVMTMIFAPLSGRLAGRGTRLPLLLSGTATTAGALLLTGLTRHSPLSLLLAAATLSGLGFSMVNAPVTATAIRGLPPDRAGLASAAASASRQLGLALGIAVTGAAVTATVHGAVRAALPAATRPGWWIIAGCGTAVTVLAVAATRQERPAALAGIQARPAERDVHALLRPQAPQPSFYTHVVAVAWVVMTIMAGAAAVPHALTALPAAAAVTVLCVLAVAEIIAVPGMLLPGGTMTLLAGALIGAGRPAIAVAVPLAAAVIGADQLAYCTGAAVTGWWRRRHPRRAGGSRPARHGGAARWLTAAMPSLAGAARMPYRSFAVRLVVMRVPWLAGMLAAGAVAARSLASAGRVAGIAGLAASAVVAAVLLAAHSGLPLRAIARHPRARLGGLLAAAGLAAWACGALLQDTAANEETVRLNPRVASLVARHVPPDAAWNAAGLSHLVQPPGLWFMGAITVMYLHVRRRGRSTVRIAAAAAASLAAAAIIDLTLPGWDRQPPVSLGAAAVAALALATVLFAARWLDPRRTGIAAAAATAAAAGLLLALAIAGQPFTAVAAGACLGTAAATTVEAAARVRWGGWLADPPRRPHVRHA